MILRGDAGYRHAKTDDAQRENADAFGRPPCIDAASTPFDDAPHRLQGVSVTQRNKEGDLGERNKRDKFLGRADRD